MQFARYRRGRHRVSRPTWRHTQLGMAVGNLAFPWVVAGYGPYRDTDIISCYDPTEPDYGPEVEARYREFVATLEARQAAGESVPWDSDGYQLARFTVADTERGPKLVLGFRPTTYYHMLVTDAALDTPLPDVPSSSAAHPYTLRQRYAADVDLRTETVPQFATHWGIGLAVVTSDDYVLIGERGATAVDADVCYPSVAEGADRPGDADATGAPDHAAIARRGLAEELGIDLAPGELTWLSFGANAVRCEFALIGLVRTRYRAAEVAERRERAAPDAWETKALHAVQFAPEAVVDFCSEPGRRCSPFALVALVHALAHEFGQRRVAEAFERAHIQVSEDLPAWIYERNE